MFGDLGYLSFGTNISSYADTCDQLGSVCKGFGSYGWMKGEVRPVDQWRR